MDPNHRIMSFNSGPDAAEIFLPALHTTRIMDITAVGTHQLLKAGDIAREYRVEPLVVRGKYIRGNHPCGVRLVA